MNLIITINFTGQQRARREEIQSNGRLTVDGKTFDFMNANTHSQGRTRWRDTGISWTANQKVEVSLTLPSSSPTVLRADPGNGQVTLHWNPFLGARGY